MYTMKDQHNKPDLSTPSMVQATHGTAAWITDLENTFDRNRRKQQRREKQWTPDTNKDEVYWEKRERNNMAARKSRENKRQMESCMKDTFRSLEEENAILKKELSILKSRLGIADCESVLSDSDRMQCLLELHQDTLNRPKVNTALVHDSGTDVSGENASRNAEMRSPASVSSNDSSASSTPMAGHSPFIGMPYRPILGNAMQYSEHVSTKPNKGKTVNNIPITKLTNKPTGNVNSGTSQAPYSYTLDTIQFEGYCQTSNYNQTATDLSIKKEKNWDDDTPAIPANNDEHAINKASHNSVKRKLNSTESEDVSSDLRMKLQDLSSQVEKMQKLVSATAHI